MINDNIEIQKVIEERYGGGEDKQGLLNQVSHTTYQVQVHPKSWIRPP